MHTQCYLVEHTTLCGYSSRIILHCVKYVLLVISSSAKYTRVYAICENKVFIGLGVREQKKKSNCENGF